MALGIDGLRIGLWTSPDRVSGCTVLLAPDGTVGAVAVRGAAPGTREAAALGPFGKLDVCHAVVLAGGSAYGLAAADGVMRWLEAQGVGYRAGPGLVPIVGAAIVLDGAVATPPARPDAAAGRAACEAAVTDDPPEGSVGAGAGVSVAKVGGLDAAWRGGQGIAVARHDDLVVGAVVVNNAVGEVFGEDGAPIAAARVPDDAERYPFATLPTDRDAGPEADAGPSRHTVIGCVVTNAALDKRGTHRVADLAHTGVARAVRPAHTEYDGDALFCLATGEVEATVDAVAFLAANVVADAARRGPLHARGAHGLPGLADPAPDA